MNLWGEHNSDHNRGLLLDASSTAPVGAATGCHVLLPVSSTPIWRFLGCLRLPEKYQKWRYFAILVSLSLPSHNHWRNSIIWVFQSSFLIGWKHLDMSFWIMLTFQLLAKPKSIVTLLCWEPTLKHRDPWSGSPRDKEGHKVRNVFEIIFKKVTYRHYIYAQTRYLQCYIFCFPQIQWNYLCKYSKPWGIGVS